MISDRVNYIPMFLFNNMDINTRVIVVTEMMIYHADGRHRPQPVNPGPWKKSRGFTSDLGKRSPISMQINRKQQICPHRERHIIHYHNIGELLQERRNSIVNALELRLSCTNPSIWVSRIPWKSKQNTLFVIRRTKLITLRMCFPRAQLKTFCLVLSYRFPTIPCVKSNGHRITIWGIKQGKSMNIFFRQNVLCKLVAFCLGFSVKRDL